MKKALLYQKLAKQKVRCRVCQRHCLIAPGKTGFCQTRINRHGQLLTIIDEQVAAVNNDPIEKKPVFHYRPGSFCLSLGTIGCNFRCLFCQNWEIAWAKAANQTLTTKKMTPQQAIKLAQNCQADGVAFTYNEPAIWLEYCLKTSRLAKKAGLYTVWVTNGYASQETIDRIAPFLDVYRVDLKSFQDRFYQKLIKVPKAAPIFRTTRYLHEKYPQIHLESVTNIIPGWNDQPKNLRALAFWIKKNLGKKTPWHVTRFYPSAKLTNVPATPVATLKRAQKIGLEAGLEFVYLGNLPRTQEENTFCPQCHTLAVKRTGFNVQVLGVDQKGRCQKCQEDLNIKP